MAKPDNDPAQNPTQVPADDQPARDPEGSRAGWLAGEDAFERRTPWRLAFWGIGAVGAVTIAVLAHQSHVDTRQDRAAIADLARRSEQIQASARESRNDIRRLTAAIDTLNGDRDRLFARATALEQGLDSVTGLIARRNAAAPPPTAAPPPSSGRAAPAPPASTPEARPETAITTPDITGSIPTEPTPAAPEVAVPRTAFAVDLGGANSIDGLRNLWRRLTAAHRAVLAGLQPAITLEERKVPAGVQLRLIAGPLDNAARAVAICAAVATRHQSCATTVFTGPKLTMAAAPPPLRPNPHPAPRAKPSSPPPAPTAPPPAPAPAR